ncbi:hypothetical protein N4Q63_26010, partial [Leclercia adecarboxylata]|uniref:hypothetical protein n=1 Tax=Leclercia adecarboxylata TaxID=83655 RepID=UPI00234CD3A0|nr:hypothetical protein [Leclercia adecarboxylata]
VASALFIKYFSVFTPHTLLHRLYLSNIYRVRTSHSTALALFNKLLCFAQGPKSELFIQNVDHWHWKHPPADGPNFFNSDGKYEKESVQDEFLTTLRKFHFIFNRNRNSVTHKLAFRRVSFSVGISLYFASPSISSL